MIKRSFSPAIWVLIGTLGAISFSAVASFRGENVSSLWILTAFICTQLIAYRFYSAFITAKVLHTDGRHSTPAKRINDGKDFVPTNKWIVFGHHFAAIAGPGPLIGPTLAAQFGYLPGTLWILIGSVFAGAVQDLIILFGSMRRDGKSLGKMIHDELGATAGYAAMIGTFMIVTILISVLGLIIVKALAHSPWGSFTVLMTIPTAMIVGGFLYHRPNAIIAASLVGVALFIAAIFGGKLVYENEIWAKFFNHSEKFIAISIMIYGFTAAVLPVWLLLTPRDYLSSFLKIGTIILLAIALFVFQPHMQMPALTQFIEGNGPIFSGKIFPFLFITIACGAISGFHALVASGTTPKMISDERDVRLIGYGSMLLESFVAVMAIIAAAILEPGIFFAINSPQAAFMADAAPSVTTAISFGEFSTTKEQMDLLATQMGENSLLSRTGGAPSLAVGMANIFSSAFGEYGKKMLSMWYHFAIMFEAIFILTTLDAGTRVARFMLEDLLKLRDKKFHESKLATILSSAAVVSAWGYFLYVGVLDPKGGINILWPLFGMSNQMLAGIALTLATVIIYKSSKKKYLFVTLIPLAFVLVCTTCAVIEKVFSENLSIGLLSNAFKLHYDLQMGVLPHCINTAEIERTVFNNQLVCIIAMIFLTILWSVVISAGFKIFAKKHRAAKNH
jgi:carbon starvation protein